MISGLLVTHECELFDYCYKESLESLLATCDEVIVVDAASKDGTRDVLSLYADLNPELTIIDAEWNPVPGTGGQWLADLYNLAKSKAEYPFQLGLQADEVLHEIDREEIRRWHHANSLKRLNFWKTAQGYLPPGVVCGDRVFRFAQHEVKFIGDAEGMEGHIRRDESAVCIFHYGFLRKTESLIAKSISFEESVFGTHNPLFDQMKEEGRRLFDEYHSGLIPYHGPHPRFAYKWLEERGYESGRYIAGQAVVKFIKPDWVGIEIGVFQGDSSKLFLEHCRFMYLIDPCESYEGNPDSTIFASEENIKRLLNGKDYAFLKGYSHLVHDYVPEVDFVFIDGNHTYEYVTMDIELYWPKVRQGGFLSGHDYGAGFEGVIRAVNEFSLKHNLPIQQHGDCWVIHKL